MKQLIIIFRYFKDRRKLWLAPVAIILVIFGLLFVFASGSALAPFIYTLF